MEKKKLLVTSLVSILILTALTVLVIFKSSSFFKSEKPDQKLSKQQEITDEIRRPSKPYKYVTEKPTGWFKTGQEADITLYATGFNESGGATVLNHPGKVATDDKKLIVSDTWNNRVLIWNEIPAKNNEPPDLVLGQPDFNSNIAGLAADKMNWPMGVSTDGKKLLVADTYNNRILIWKEFPTKNGQPADLVLGADDFSTRFSEFGERDKRTYIDNPWDVWTDGKKVVTSGGPVLIWNSFPTKNNQPADIIVGVQNFSERFGAGEQYIPNPRGIASDGKRLILGTYEPRGMYVYNEFPTKNGKKPDFFLPLEHWGAMGLDIKDDKLLTVSHSHFFIWNSFPDSARKADIIYEPRRTNEQIVLRPDKQVFYPDQIGYAYGIAASDKLIIADSNNNRVLIFNKIPTKEGEEADVILGKPEMFLSRNSFGSGPNPYSDGQRLFVGADGYGVWIYNHLPDESKAEADVVLGLNIRPNYGVIGGRVTTDGEKLFMVHRNDKSMIFIWNKIPNQDNQKPDIFIGGEKSIGRDGMRDAVDIDTDGKHLFVTDTGNNRVLVWNNIPEKNQGADFVLGQDDFNSRESGNAPNKFSNPVGVSSNGKHLAVVDMENQRILIWKLPIIENGQIPDLILREMKFENREEPMHFNLPQDVMVYDDKLFVADGGFNRVLIWNKFPETKNTPPDIVLGQKDFYGSSPSNARDRLFTPVSINFDGSFLWIGETKYSNRLLRFSVQPNP